MKQIILIIILQHLLENTIAQPASNAANGILKNATIAVLLKYLGNFWRSLEMPLIDCKVELELKWTKYCVFSAGGTENMMLKILDILLKTTKLYLPIVTLSARDNQKLSKLLSKGFEWSVYWN